MLLVDDFEDLTAVNSGILDVLIKVLSGNKDESPAT